VREIAIQHLPTQRNLDSNYVDEQGSVKGCGSVSARFVPRLTCDPYVFRNQPTRHCQFEIDDIRALDAVVRETWPRESISTSSTTSFLSAYSL
jgi:hypothetical protein